MAASNKAKTLTKNLITNEIIAKMNKLQPTKEELAKASGYTSEVASSRDLRSSKTYVEMVNHLTGKLGNNIFEYVESIDKDIKCGIIETQSLDTKIKQLNTLVSIMKGLSPSFKQKETKKGEDGTYSTTWTTLNS